MSGPITVPRPPRQKGPTYSAIREAILARRQKPEPVKLRKRGRPRKDRTAPRDNRQLPISGPADTATKVRDVLERGMNMAEQIGAVNLKAQLVAAHSELRRQLIRSRELRRRMDAMVLPDRMDQDEGKAWIERQLGRLVLDAAHQGDFEGALAAAKTLGVLAGHLEEQGGRSGGGVDVNFNLAAVVQRLDAEEREEPKLIEGESTRGDLAVERLLNGPPVDSHQPAKASGS
jgi:hypothetical protein